MRRVRCSLAVFVLLAEMGTLVEAEVPPARADRVGSKDRFGDLLPPRALDRLGTTRLRDNGGVVGMALSPDGKVLASLSHCGDVRFWDPGTGKLIRKVIEGVDWYQSPSRATAFFTHIAFAAGGKSLCCVIENRIQVRELATGKTHEIKIPRGVASHQARAAAISSDGKMVARAAWDANNVCLVDLTEGAIAHILNTDKDVISALAFSPDGRLLAGAGQYSADIFLWNTVTGTEVTRLKGHKKRVWALAFSPDGKALVSSGGDAPFMYRVWDIKERRLLRQFKGGGSLAFSPDGKTLALGERGVVRLVDAKTDKTLLEMPFPSLGIDALSFAPDGKSLFVQGGYVIKAWKLPGGEEAFPWSGHVAPVCSLAFAPDGKRLASRGLDHVVRVWDMATRHQEHLLLPGRPAWYDPGDGGSQTVVFSPDGNTLMGGGNWGPFARWDARTGKALERIRGTRGGGIKALAFSPDGGVFAGCRWGTGLYSVADRKQTHLLTDTPEGMRLRHQDTAVAFSPDGRTLAIGDSEHIIRIWDWHTSRVLRQFEAPKPDVSCLAYSPDGKILGSCAGRRGFSNHVKEWEVCLWEAATGRLIRRLQGHKGVVECFAFAPDGRSLVSGGRSDRTVRVWQFWTGKEITHFEGHDGAVNCVAYAPDGRTVASGSDDTTILLWDTSKLDTRFPPTALGSKERKQCWLDLQDANPATAYQAIAALAGAKDEAVTFLRTQLRPVTEPDRKRVAQLIADLGADDFTVRDAARKELERFGEAAAPALRRALDAKPGVEVRTSLERVLREVDGPSPSQETLRGMRALQVLEQIGSPQARACVAELAKGIPTARLTVDAQQTLKRLDRRLKPR